MSRQATGGGATAVNGLGETVKRQMVESLEIIEHKRL
jgi:hypothetical protein